MARLLGRLLGAVRFRRLALRLRAGCEDPADTGLVAAWVFSLLAPLPAAARDHVQFEPDFGGEAWEWVVDAELRLVPIRFVLPVVQFALSPSTLRGLAALRGS